MTQTISPTQALSDTGVSIWLDDLSRARLTSGSLAGLLTTHSVVGVTTNPSIFAQALQDGESYRAAIAQQAESGASVTEAVFAITSNDVADACDLLAPVYDASQGFDGRVSIEVEPGLARDADGTVAQAESLWARVNRPNAMIKIPATVEGLEAITRVVAQGISVNVTLIFSLERYRQVINAYLTGLEQARVAGIDLSTIHSVASFFVSRVDTEIDARLRALGTPDALALTGQAGVANAHLAYEVFTDAFQSERARYLLGAGANLQRPLWASTGVKDPELPDTLYVTELAAPHTVNTMPEATLNALADHGVVSGDRVTGTSVQANSVLNELDGLGIDYGAVTELLEREGLEKFDVAWAQLLETVQTALLAAR